MASHIKLYGIALLLLGLMASGARGASSEEVEEALRRAKEYLYSQQRDGTWEHIGPGGHGDQATGPTALAVYALLVSGESAVDPRIARAIEFLKRTDATGVYALALRCMIWGMLSQTAEMRQLMAKDARVLLDSIHKEQDGLAHEGGVGHYDYNPRDRAPMHYSHSRSNYAILGLWTAAQSGFEVPRQYWEFVAEAWVRNQDSSGGWSYRRTDETDHPLTPGMTAAGVATLFIVQDMLNIPEGRGNPLTRPLELGVQWLVDNFDGVATDRRYDRDWPYPTLFAVERVGLASGWKYFGDRDWYMEGARWLVKEQGRNGSWSLRSGPGPRMGPLYNTCFGILFLSYGRAPVIFNKLNYTTDARRPARWNQRPRDVANLTRWIGDSFERTLNWQVLSLETASLSDLLDAPILYIAGNQPLQLEQAHKEKLRAFVEHGGLILGHADGGAAGFGNSFRRLGTELFPSYEFREMPADHPIYTIQFSRERWEGRPNVLGLSNGVRELMLLLPQGDPSRAWQENRPGQRNRVFWELAANIVHYSIDSQYLRYKDQKFLVEADQQITPDRIIRVGRLEYAGNWNPEPGGWRRLANLMHNNRQVNLEVRVLKLGEGDPKDVEVAHLTGTTPIKLSEEAREELRQFVRAGGTLVVDAAGGMSEFAQASEDELREMFPEGELKLLPQDHAVFTAGDEPLREFGYRAAAQEAVMGQLRVPRVQGIEIDGRIGVFYSREDLSVGLVGQPVAGIVGYDPETATAIMQRVLLYAVGRPQR
jgi:hypothetical protein